MMAVHKDDSGRRRVRLIRDSHQLRFTEIGDCPPFSPFSRKQIDAISSSAASRIAVSAVRKGTDNANETRG